MPAVAAEPAGGARAAGAPGVAQDGPPDGGAERGEAREAWSWVGAASGRARPADGLFGARGNRYRARVQSVKHVLWVTLALNVLVAVAKLVVGKLIGSLTLVSDGVHSLTDGSSNVIGLVSMAWAARPADASHPYGHQKFEILAATAVGVSLFITAWEIGRHAVSAMLTPSAPPTIDALGFVVVGVTFAVNVFVASYERAAGKRLQSPLLLADAAHTASDLFVTLSVLASLVACRLGAPWLDPVIALGIGAFIALLAFRLLLQNVTVLADGAPIPSEDIERIVLAVPGVRSCHKIRTRGYAGHIWVDLHVRVDPHLDTIAGHRIVHDVQAEVRRSLPGIEDVLIHTEPASASDGRDRSRDESSAGARPPRQGSA